MKLLYFPLTFMVMGLIGFWTCNNKNKNVNSEIQSSLFKLHTSNRTGLKFNNELTPTADLNIFHYMYFYNGGGIAVADFNKDNFQDIYFTSNQSTNKLYLNNGDLTFTDVSDICKTSGEGGWSTG